MRSPTELTELFRERGKKVTPQRQAVFSVLDGNAQHPTAEAIHARVSTEMPTVSLRTVYQVLHDLADMGEIHQLDVGTGSSRFDPNLEPHHHLVCDSCGKVQDVHVDVTDVRLTESDLAGFRVSSTQIIFRGRCPSCRAGSGTDTLRPHTTTRQRKAQHG